jgi:hypothetical protein
MIVYMLKFLGVEWVYWPFKYLGILIHYIRLLNKEWKPFEDPFERKFGG